MRIVFTGGGTGGHFYPIIAVAQKLNHIIDTENILESKLYYMSDKPYDPEMLFENSVEYVEVASGKMRVAPSPGDIIKNLFGIFRAFFGFWRSLFKLYSIYPDVVFGKGGYASAPVVLAAIVLRIPLFIHESDSVPGRVNRFAGHFAKRVAVSFPEAAEYFPKKKVAWTGHPIRLEVEIPASREEALRYFKFDSDLPVLLVMGGSQGAELINNTVLDALPRLTQSFQIIHQAGVSNFKDVSLRSRVALQENQNRARYLLFPFLNPLVMKMAAGAASVVVSRAGSTIFEIASWGTPSILVPITASNGDHQRKNAFNYAHTGAGVVIEEANMTPNVLCEEVERIASDRDIWSRMSERAKGYHHPGAAEKIARELVNIALAHEK